MPLVLAVALAVGAGDHPLITRRRPPRPPLDRRTGRHRQHPLLGGITWETKSATVVYDATPAVRQSAWFDAATGALTWFDDDYN